MSNIIFWKQFDEPMKVVDAKTGEERIIEGEWACTDERVGKVMQYGAMSANPKDGEASLYSALWFKNGDNKTFKNDYDFSQAEQYLTNLK